MTKFHSPIPRTPETDTDTVSIHTVSKKHKIQLLKFQYPEYRNDYICSRGLERGINIPFEVFIESDDSCEECESIFGILRVSFDDYEPGSCLIDYLREIGKFGKICNKLLKFDWSLPDNARLQKIVLSPLDTLAINLGSIERQFVITPSFCYE
ncbi:MAG TPA: hypothetical protein VIF10_14395 [Methylobacter sp.]|jgi:hypothetical protein